MKLTDAQTNALSTIVAAWDEANAREQKRWGTPLRGGIAILRGKADARTLTFDLRSIRALDAAGLIELETYQSQSESLRRGSYGRWIGGTTTRLSTGMLAKPTALGRAYLKENR